MSLMLINTKIPVLILLLGLFQNEVKLPSQWKEHLHWKDSDLLSTPLKFIFNPWTNLPMIQEQLFTNYRVTGLVTNCVLSTNCVYIIHWCT